MHAIPTRYNGVNYRSRLEAKWARFFDLLEWPHEYEPLDLDGYIPDFVLKFKKPIAVEIKPAFNLLELRDHASKAISACRKAGLPLLSLGATFMEESSYCTVGLGLIDDEPAEFSYCTRHKGYSFYPPEGSWVCMRCQGECQKTYNKPYWFWDSPKGDYSKSDDCDYRDSSVVASLWNESRNLTQYKRIFLAGKG